MMDRIFRGGFHVIMDRDGANFDYCAPMGKGWVGQFQSFFYGRRHGGR